jgi:hypothetical protein
VEAPPRTTPDLKTVLLLIAKEPVLFPMEVEPVLPIRVVFLFSLTPIRSSNVLESKPVVLNEPELKPLNPLLVDLDKPPLG